MIKSSLTLSSDNFYPHPHVLTVVQRDKLQEPQFPSVFD